MVLMLKLITYLLFINASNCFIKLPQISEDILLNPLEKYLRNLLHNLPDNIQIKVRWDSINEDVKNPYVHWFLQYDKLPVTISSYKPQKFMIIKKVSNNSQNLYVIVCSLNQIQRIVKALLKITGFYLFVINNEQIQYNIQELHDIFHHMWQKHFIYHNYVLTEEGIFRYDPFTLRETGGYRKIVKYLGENSNSFFQNLHGYPLRVQMFRSVYSRPIYDVQTRSIKGFKGVDGKVANLLQEKLNFTMILQKPDENLFG